MVFVFIFDVVAALDEAARRSTGGFSSDELSQELGGAVVRTLAADGAAVMTNVNDRCRFVWAQLAKFSPMGRLQQALQAG